MAEPDEISGERLKRIFDIWNARINPPDRPSTLADVIFNTKKLDARNKHVNELKNLEREYGKQSTEYNDKLNFIKVIEKHTDFPFNKLKLDSTEPYTIEAVNRRQKDFATDSFREFTPIDQNKVVTYINELASEINRKRVEAGYESQIMNALNFVYDNLFYNWELDKAGNARMTDRIERDISPEDVAAFEVIEGANKQLGISREVAANYMTRNDLYWKAVDAAVDNGLYPSSFRSMLRNGGIKNPDEAEQILERMGVSIDPALIDPGAAPDPVGQLDDIVTRWNQSVNEMLQRKSQDIRYSTNPVHFMDNLASRTVEGVEGPEDLFPRLAENERLNEQLYMEFTQQEWNFNKDIEHNLKSLMANEIFDAEMDDFGDETLFTLDPNSSSWPKTFTERFDKSDIKREISREQSRLIDEILETPEGKAYIAALNDRTTNPSIEQSFSVYRAYTERIGEAGADFIKTVDTKLKHDQNSSFRERINDINEREKLAKEYLSRVDGVRDRYKEKHFKPLIDKLTKRIFNYANFEQLRKDTELEAEIINDYNEIVKSRPFDADINTIEGRNKELDAILQEVLTEAEYDRYKNADDAVKFELSAMLGNYENQSQAVNDPEFREKLSLAVFRGSQNITREREEEEAKARAKRLTAEEKARSARVSDLNRNLDDYIFEEFRTRGIVGPDSSQEYLDHIRNTIVPQMAQRSVLGGGVTTIEEITALVDEAVGQPDRAGRFTGGYLNMFDVSESDFIRQMVPTDLPPGVTPQMVARPTPAFDISQFAPQLMDLSFDRPEFASFIQSEAQKPEFEKMWQKASEATPRRDRAAEIRLQEERLAGFERALGRETEETELDRARTQLEEEQTQLEEARTRLRAAETPTTTEDVAISAESVRAARRAVADAERMVTDAERMVTAAPRSAAETAFERAQAQFEREVPSQVTEGQPGFFRSEQNLADIRKMMVQPGQTQKEFFESQLPGFERRFEASPFFKQQQERTEQEEERERRMAEAEERRAESERRTLLRSGRGGGVGTARTIFRRGRT